MRSIQSKVMDNLVDDMIKWRGLAFKNYMLAKEVQRAYVEKFESGDSRYAFKVDAERAAATDVRFTNAVANNQMYDRFAMRDAAVLTSLTQLWSAGLLQIRNDAVPNNPNIEPLTKNEF